MSVGILLPIPSLDPILDAAGHVAAAGTLSTYKPGTTITQITYSDAALTVPNSNPITLNGAGLAVVYLDPTLGYKLLAKDAAGATLWTRDNAYLPSPPTVLSKTTDYTVTAADGADVLVLMDATSGARTVALPTAVGVAGHHVTIKKTDTSSNAVTADPNGAEAIDGASTYALTEQYAFITLASDGAGWAIVAGGSDQSAVQTTTAIGTQNNLAVASARRLVLRCNNASLLTITGFAPTTAARDGDVIEIVPINAQIDLSHNSASSTTGNKLANLVTSCVTSICESGSSRGGGARYVFDALTNIWRLAYHEQGGWIASTISTTTANGGGSLTSTTIVDSRYRISGRTLEWGLAVAFELNTGTVTTADLNLPVAGMTAGGKTYAPFAYFSATFYQGRARATAAGVAFVRFDALDGGGIAQSFQGGTNNFQGTFVGDIQ